DGKRIGKIHRYSDETSAMVGFERDGHRDYLCGSVCLIHCRFHMAVWKRDAGNSNVGDHCNWRMVDRDIGDLKKHCSFGLFRISLLWLRLLTDHQIWALFMTIVFNFVFVWLLGSGWGTSFYFIGLPADHSHTVGHGMMIFVIYVGWIISISLLIFYVLEKRDLFYRETRCA